MERDLNMLTRTFTGKRVFITGHTGFKGSWLSLWLKLLGAEVTGYALPAERTEDHFNVLNLRSQIDHIEGNILDFDRLTRSMQAARPEFVFHLAAQPLVRRSYLEPRETFETNVTGSVNVLEAVRSLSSQPVLIYVTSDKCYRDQQWNWGYRENDPLGGHDPYSASKACAELVFSSYQQSFFAASGLRAGSVRAGNVIGGGDWAPDRIVPDCIRALRSGRAIQIRNPRSVRPWQHVLEPLAGYLTLAALLAQADAETLPRLTGQAWNYGPAQESHRTVTDLADVLIERWGEGETVVTAAAENWKETAMLYLNCDKTLQQVGWRPRWDFEATIQATVDWYRCWTKGVDPWKLSCSQIGRYMEARA